jgi:hypothetical protein
MTEAANTSETSVNFYQITWRSNPVTSAAAPVVHTKENEMLVGSTAPVDDLPSASTNLFTREFKEATISVGFPYGVSYFHRQ